MAQIPDDMRKGRKRRMSAAEKRERTGRLISENPILAQVVYSKAGPMGTMTPQDDGSWTGCRYGPGYPENTIRNATEDEALDYVLNGAEQTDGPNPHPWVEHFWKEQEEEAKRYEAELAARALATPPAKRT